MPEIQTFGRRQAPSAPRRVRPPQPQPRAAAAPLALDPRAEAFAAQLVADRRAGSGFDQWRRSESSRRWLFRGLTLASFAPGLVSAVIDAPMEISVGLEVGALILNVWLRAERRRRLRAIVSWEDGEGDPG